MIKGKNQEDALNLSPLPLAVFVADAQGTIRSWNRACEKLAGHSAAEMHGHPLGELLQFDDPNGQVSIRDRVDSDSVGQLICADGRRLPVRVTVAPQSLDPDHSGCFSIIVIPRGGTAPSRYSLIQDLPVNDIIEGLPCVFYVIDQSGRLLLWNHQLEDALEMDSAELPTVEVKYFFEESERTYIVQKILDALENGASYHEAEVVGKHGKRTSFLFHCARTSLGSLPVIFGTGLDITARKKKGTGHLRQRERDRHHLLRRPEEPHRVRESGLRAHHRL
jgi:PAS domain S-box-containing protein